MGIYTEKASGLARCKICKKKIEKDTISIKFYGYRIGEHYHFDCIKNLELKHRS